MPLRLILSTCAPNQAEEIVRGLLAERLIGCANIVPGVRSLFEWSGAIADEAESILLMETTSELVDQVMKRLGELHSYEVPKILVLDPERANFTYESWLTQLLRRST